MRFLFLMSLLLPLGCAGDSAWRPMVPRTETSTANVATQYVKNRDVSPSRQRHVVILVMTPAYGTAEQIRAGNMGHVAIEVNGRLHDMGSLNGYAFTFAPSTAVRFWPWPTADEAVAAVKDHPDCDGNLDEFVRFDVTVTNAQADLIENWWQQTEAKMADPGNHLYVWHGLQCASAVVMSLQSAGVIPSSPSTPEGVRADFPNILCNTAGPAIGQPAVLNVIQKAVTGKQNKTSGLQLLNVPRLLNSGGRSALDLSDPDGHVGPILWSDGQPYKDRVKTFAINPATAVAHAVAADPQVAAGGVQSIPNFAVGRWYHLDTDHVIGQAAAGGWWVNGDTGKVIHVDDVRVIRFDLFQGDRLTP